MGSRRSVFFVSDRTGITVEILGNSLLTQFEEVSFRRITIPFIQSRDDMQNAIAQINRAVEEERQRPLVFLSIVDDAMNRELREKTQALTLDFFQAFISPLEKELGLKSAHAAGRSHSVNYSTDYFRRMEAINFAQSHDDGAATRELSDAEVILVGVSRCGKTPTALYLAMQFGIRAANFPLTPDDFADHKLPDSLLPLRHKLFGLTIDPKRLSQIRQERRASSHYASLGNCRQEVRSAESLMARENIPMLDTSAKSIEEIAATIIHLAKLNRHFY
ncbi:MAG: kinase/pyrophosphorylase [Burkholderiales bacterium]|jgi:regulator of PEP synthase PpsR (kinase-PPPase family)|nr:kinase/pyrophosphorylase [Burkholderiales bacterium]